MQRLKLISLKFLLAIFCIFSTLTYANDNSISLNAIEFRTTSNIDKLPSLDAITSKFIGHSIDANLLSRLLNEVTTYYRENGYPSSRAYLPEQSIDNSGVVLVDIVYTQISDIDININKNFIEKSTKNMIFSPLKDLVLHKVQTNKLEKELLMLSDLGQFDIKASMSEDVTDLSHATINVDVSEKQKLTGAFVADNHGIKSTGEYRLYGYGLISNLTGHLDSLSLFLASTNKDQRNFNINYEIPITKYKTLLGFGSCFNNYELGENFDFLGAKGSSLSAEVFIKQPLLRDFNTKTEFYTGFRYRDIKDEFELFDIKFKKHSLSLYTSLQSQNKLTDNLLLSSMAKLTLGKLYNDDEYELAEDSSFAIGNFNANLNYLVDKNIDLFLDLQSQFASTNLDGSEFFSIGGADGVAAFASNKAAGDYGYLLKTGFNLKGFKEILIVSPNLSLGRIAYKGFGDGVTLSSAGLDLTLRYRGFFTKIQGSTPLSKKDEDDDSFKIFGQFGYSFI